MKNELENLLMFLQDNQNMNYDANNQLKYLSEEIVKFTNKLPTIEKLEELKKIEIELETKYENLYELGNYFDPVFIQIKQKIKEDNVTKIREENRTKREGNL